MKRKHRRRRYIPLLRLMMGPGGIGGPGSPGGGGGPAISLWLWMHASF